MPENGELSSFECYKLLDGRILTAIFLSVGCTVNQRKAPGQHAPGTTLVQLTKAHLFHPNSLRLRVAVSLSFFCQFASFISSPVFGSHPADPRSLSRNSFLSLSSTLHSIWPLLEQKPSDLLPFYNFPLTGAKINK